MQEQSSEKTVGLAVQTSKMTGRVLIRAFEKYLYHRKELNRDKKYAERTDPSKNPINQVKRVKVKNLVKEGSPLSTVELRDANIRQFDRLAKKNGVRYAIKKDKSTSPPTYIVFFKAKDGEMVNRTMKEFLTKAVKPESKEKKDKGDQQGPIHEKLNEFKEKVEADRQKNSRVRHKQMKHEKDIS